MALDLSKLTEALEAETNAKAAVLAYVEWVAGQIGSLPADKAAIDALAAQVKATAEEIAAAVVVNTPAEPPV